MGTDQRVVLIPGGVRGLGLAAARAFSREGARVHVASRSASGPASGPASEFADRAHRADLTRAGEARALVESVLARDGRLDVLVHAVGDFAVAPLEEGALESWRALAASNVESALAAFDAARAALRSSRGSALFFGCAGLAAWRARRQVAVYAAAKSALYALVRSLALEEARHGVRVNLVSPGLVPHEHAHPSSRDPERAARLPFGRAGTPEEVARAVCWLCSDAASYVTGLDLEVAGGWMS